MSEDTAHASVTLLPPEPWAITVRETQRVESCGRTVVYERAARGEYDAVKDDGRLKITTASINRRRKGLPKAKLKPPTPRAPRKRKSARKSA
jgi:hypothetical protein